MLGKSGPALTLNKAALRNKWLRSIGKLVDPRSVAAGTLGSRAGSHDKAEKVPQEVLDQMKTAADEAYWFQLWCASDCKWGQARLWINKRQQEILEDDDKWAWMTFSQMEKHFNSTAMATKLKSVCLVHPKRWQWHPDLPGDEAGMQFWVEKETSQSHKKRNIEDSGFNADALVTGNAAQLAQSRYGIGNVSLSDGRTQETPFKHTNMPGPPTKTSTSPSTPGSGTHGAGAPQETPKEDPEEVAAKAAEQAAKEEEEQKAAKEEEQRLAQIEEQKTNNERKQLLEQQRKKLAADPKFQSTKWLTGLARVLTDLDEEIKKASRASRLPANGRPTCKQMFMVHKQTRLAHRT